jgi:hypothetical protein
MGLSDFKKMLRDGLSMSTLGFVAQTLHQMCNPQPEYGSDFNNLLKAIHNYPPKACAYLSLLVRSPENTCFGLLVGLIEYWTIVMAESFPNTAAGLWNAELEFVKRKK